MSDRERDEKRPRGFALWGICILLGIVLVSFVIQVMTTRVRTVKTWQVEVVSDVGLPPADVYIGEEFLGSTPLTIACDRDDPQFQNVERRERRKAGTIMATLGFDLEINYPPQKAEIEPDFLAWTILGEWPDGTLDEFIYLVVRDGFVDKFRSFVLRARRPGEKRVRIGARRDWNSTQHGSWFQRTFFRISHRHETLRITLGQSPRSLVSNPERPWLFEKTPVGAKRLVTPRTSNPATIDAETEISEKGTQR